MILNRCLLCYQDIESEREHVHTKCSQQLFGGKYPVLSYSYNELATLATEVIRSQVTVPGVQAKLSMNLTQEPDKTMRLTLVGIMGNYILKPPVPQYPQMPEIEDLTMHLANILGIETVPHGLIYLKSGELAYITRRIDLTKTGSKLFMEDMCQLTERLTEDKYKGSMEQVGKTIRKYSDNPLLDIIHYFEVVLFSFLSGNADMHLKNFSLIYPVNAMVQLAPAYDLISTRLLISEQDDSEEMALTLNGKKSKLKLEDFISFGKTMGLNEKQMSNTFKRLQSNFDEAYQFIEHSFLSEENKLHFQTLLQRRASRLHLSD